MGGCASVPVSPPTPGGELISYETSPGPFCGRCDSIKLTAVSDGRVWIEHGRWYGDYTDWRVARRRVKVSPDQFAQFRQQLVAYRPAGDLALDGRESCAAFYTDMSEVTVAWRGGGADASLRFNYGCDPEARAEMAAALAAAPKALGVRNLRIPDNDWVATTRM
jgi:hypothetical protein